MPRGRSLAELAGGNRSNRATGIVRGNLVDSSQPRGSSVNIQNSGIIGDELRSMAMKKGKETLSGLISSKPSPAASAVTGTGAGAEAVAAGAAAPTAAGAAGAGAGAGIGAGAAAAAAGAAAAPAAAAGAAGAAGTAAGAAKAAGLLKAASALCWVAAEYYQRDSTDWTRCRNWVLSHPLLTKVYGKYGEAFADFLRRHPLAHWLFRPVVEHAHRRGKL